MTMERKIYWSIGILSVLIFASSFFTPDKPDNRHDQPLKNDLPWQIEHPTPDTVRIFGLTLGQNTGNEAELRFKEIAVPSLFKSPSGQLVAEIFFEQVTLAGLKSKIVLNIAVPDTELQGMYERGLRMSGTGSGKKITLTPDDITRLRNLPISGLTYLPTMRVEDALLLKRFGKPVQIVKETQSGAIHWLYPQNGLDITLGGAEKPLLQYVSPKEFGKLTKPLLTNGEIVTQ